VNNQNFYIWSSHRQHAAWLFQTVPYWSIFSATAALLVPGANTVLFLHIMYKLH